MNLQMQTRLLKQEILLRTCQIDVLVSYLVSAIIKIVFLLDFILPDHIYVTLPCFGRL